MVARIIQLLVCLCLIFPAHAQLVLDEHASDIFLTDQNSSFGIDAGDSHYYWIETKIQKTTTSDFLIECLAPQLKDIKAYVLTERNDTIRSFVTGANYPFGQRDLLHKNFVFPLNMEPGKYTIRIGVRDIQPDELYFKIRSDHFFTEYAI